MYSDGKTLSVKMDKTKITFVGPDHWNPSETRTWYITAKYTKTTD